MKLFNNGSSCQRHVYEFALYFAMEQTNLVDLRSRPKQTEIWLKVWHGKDVTGLYINLAYYRILEIGSHSGSSFNK